MAVTPQTNIDLPSVARFLASRDDFVICGHVSPDGDCLGSQLGLAAALRSLGKRATCLLAKDEPVDTRLGFLPGIADMVPASSFSGEAATFVAVDVPTRERMGEAAVALLDRCAASLTLDHHAADTAMTELAYVDPEAASVTMLVWEVARLMRADRVGDVATCCYTGLVTDTGRFQYQNTDRAALAAAADMVGAGADPSSVSREVFQNRSLASIRLESIAVDRMELEAGGSVALSWLSLADFAALDAVKADAEPVIDALRSVAGVRVACVLREQDDVVRGSIRAKDDTDVAAIARHFGGGGHRAAAGFTLKRSLEEARGIVRRVLVEAVGAGCDRAVDAVRPSEEARRA